jgi:ketosteroid isomerase-like protein
MAEAATAPFYAALIKSGYDAFARGDLQGAFAVFAEDILWHIPGRGPLSRDYRGHAEVLGFFQHFMELSHRTFRIEIDDILAKGDRVVVLCTESAQRGGRSWSTPQRSTFGPSRTDEPPSSGSTRAISRPKTSSGRRRCNQNLP